MSDLVLNWQLISLKVRDESCEAILTSQMSSTFVKIIIEVVGGRNDTSLILRFLVGREKKESDIYCLPMCIINPLLNACSNSSGRECVSTVSKCVSKL